MYRIVLNETSYYGAGCRSVIADEIRKRGANAIKKEYLNYLFS